MNEVSNLNISKKKRAVLQFQQNESLFQCPICRKTLQVVQQTSMRCNKGHCFDITKRGYINFLTKPSRSHYSAALFQARQSIMTETALFTPILEQIKALLPSTAATDKPLSILDAGTGEGSQLASIIGESTALGIGIDIAKEGIALAARQYGKQLWLVGDLANAPLANEQFDVILNILSPASYNEFHRLLKGNGLLIKVIPQQHYLQELRKLILGTANSIEYTDHSAALFARHVELLHRIPLHYTVAMDQQQLLQLFRMSPLSWHHEHQLQRFSQISQLEVTIDVQILVGKKKAVY